MPNPQDDSFDTDDALSRLMRNGASPRELFYGLTAQGAPPQQAMTAAYAAGQRRGARGAAGLWPPNRHPQCALVAPERGSRGRYQASSGGLVSRASCPTDVRARRIGVSGSAAVSAADLRRCDAPPPGFHPAAR